MRVCGHCQGQGGVLDEAGPETGPEGWAEPKRRLEERLSGRRGRGGSPRGSLGHCRESRAGTGVMGWGESWLMGSWEGTGTTSTWVLRKASICSVQP